MSARTVFLGRLIALYCILVGLAFAARKEAVVAAVTALIHDPAILLVLGVVTLAAGLAMVLAHNVWSGGVMPVVVTLIGWISLVKGLFFLILSPEAMVSLLAALRYAELFYVYVAINVLIGLYLVVAAARAERFTFQDGVSVEVALHRA
jgi:hypothetical protein